MDALTAREAIAAELFADLDKLTRRVETLPTLVEAAGSHLKSTTADLRAGADQYRLALTAFNAEARDELADLIKRKSEEASAQVVEQHRTSLHEIVRTAFRSEASDKAASLAAALEHASREMRIFRRHHLIETILTSIASSMVTAALFIYWR